MFSIKYFIKIFEIFIAGYFVLFIGYAVAAQPLYTQCPIIPPYQGATADIFNRDSEFERTALADFYRESILPVERFVRKNQDYFGLLTAGQPEVKVMDMVAKSLIKTYDLYHKISKDQGVVIEYVQAINQSYRSNTYNGLDTKGAKAIISLQAPDIMKFFGGSIICVEPWVENRSRFATHIYSVKSGACENFRTHPAINGLGQVFVNGVEQGPCEDDYPGWAPRPWLWHYGVNQVTLVFGKFAATR